MPRAVVLAVLAALALAGCRARTGDAGAGSTVREKASGELIALGPRAVPLLAAQAAGCDPEVAARLRAAVPRMAGAPGEEVEGLRLSATQIGRRPRPGQAVTLWLTITNASDHDVCVLQYFWRLSLQPEAQKGTDHARVVRVNSAAEHLPQDFLRLRPGQSAGYLMDADPIASARGARLAQAYLEMSVPEGAEKAVDGSVFSGHEELVSGPIEMTYLEEPAGPDAEAEKLAAAFLAGGAGAERRLDPRQEEPAARDLALRAVRSGLRRADARERWRIFEFVWGHPCPALEDDVLDFVARYGPRLKQEEAMLTGLRAFRDVLPGERRLAFVYRAALAMIHDWRSVSILVFPYSNSSDAAERALAARAYLLLYERGDRRPETLKWLALELFCTPDAKLRDAGKALELAELGVKLHPDSADCRLALACVRGKKEELATIAADARTPGDQNSLAWDLATRFPARSGLADTALDLATRAVAAVSPDDRYRRAAFLDTLAVCCAAKGDYARALEREEQALGVDPDHADRGEFAARIARFTALAVAGEDERPAMVLDAPRLRSAASRDALIARLRAEKNGLVRAELGRLLAECFGSDAGAIEALKSIRAEEPPK